MNRFILLVIIFFTPVTYANLAKGIIEEVRVCGTGVIEKDRWIRTLLFKVSGEWFGTFADHYSFTLTSVDNNMVTSLVMMSYSQKKEIEINATGDWNYNFSNCGIPEGSVFHGNKGDYIKLK